MPAKGDIKEMQLTPIKVGPEQTFGDNGKKYIITVAEDLPDSLQVFAPAGADAIKAVLNQTVPFTLSFMNEYQSTLQWKITKVPGWEQGQGGGKNRNWQPRLDHPNQRAEMLVAEAFQSTAVVKMGHVETVEQLIAAASQVADAMVEMSLEIAKRLPASAASEGSGTPAGGGVATSPPGPDLRPDLWPALVEAFRIAYTAAGIGKDDAEGRSKFMADTIGPVARGQGWPFPPTLETLTAPQHDAYVTAFSNSIVAGIAGTLA